MQHPFHPPRSLRSLYRASAILVPLGLLTLHELACDEGSHVYQSQLFIEGRDCLGTTSSVDVVDGDPPTHFCQPTCLAQVEADGGRSIYVGAMCPPFPYLFDASGGDPDCPEALAALARGDICLIDGSSTEPLPPVADAATE